MSVSQTLYEAIQANPTAKAAFEAGDQDAAVAAALNATTIKVMDEFPYKTMRWLMDVLSDADYAQVSLSLRHAAGLASSEDPQQQALGVKVDDAFTLLRSTGLDLSNDQTREKLDLLAASYGWSDELLATIKAGGATMTSRAAQILGREATAEDVADARSWNAGLEFNKLGVVVSLNKDALSGKVRLTIIKRPVSSDGKQQQGQTIVLTSSDALGVQSTVPDAIKTAVQTLLAAGEA